MTRVAVLVESDFLVHHVGVRNYLFALRHYLTAAGHDVQFVAAHRPAGEPPHWVRVHLTDPRLAADNGLRTDWRVAAPAAGVMAAYRATAPAPDPPAADTWVCQLGPQLADAGADVLVVGNPWLVDFEGRPAVRRVVGLAFDCIPNRMCLTHRDKPFAFAARHRRGYALYRDRCDHTLAISETVADDLRGLFHFPAGRVSALPPLVPPACLAPPLEGVRRRPGAVLLASPLDRRKGLAVLPDLIAGLGDAARVLLMYGGERCPPADVPAFFGALPPGLPVEWYPRATAATTERLFREAALLLFPSESEGLGLPLVEAQLRGCPAVVRPRRPMTDLVLPGSQTLPGDPAGDRAVVRELMTDTGFDHAALAAAARRFFGVDTLADRVAAAVLGG